MRNTEHQMNSSDAAGVCNDFDWPHPAPGKYYYICCGNAYFWQKHVMASFLEGRAAVRNEPPQASPCTLVYWISTENAFRHQWSYAVGAVAPRTTATEPQTQLTRRPIEL